MGARRASTNAVLAVLGVLTGVLLVSVLVTWAASIGPGDVLTGAGPATHRISVSPTESPTPSDVGPARDPVRQRPASTTDHPVLRAIALAIEVALGVLFLYLLQRLLRRLVAAYVDRRRPAPRPPTIDFDVLEAVDLVLDQMAADAQPQREALLSGEPRNAIVECWHRFEQQAAAAGLARRRWETSAEFTLRMLELVDAAPSVVERLAGLYREARFSDHAVDEEHRAAAVAALDAIHAGLPVRTGGHP